MSAETAANSANGTEWREIQFRKTAIWRDARQPTVTGAPRP